LGSGLTSGKSIGRQTAHDGAKILRFLSKGLLGIPSQIM
jgi:hypothetical protein